MLPTLSCPHKSITEKRLSNYILLSLIEKKISHVNFAMTGFLNRLPGMSNLWLVGCMWPRVVMNVPNTKS